MLLIEREAVVRVIERERVVNAVVKDVMVVTDMQMKRIVFLKIIEFAVDLRFEIERVKKDRVEWSKIADASVGMT